MLQIPPPKEVHLVSPRRRAFFVMVHFLWNITMENRVRWVFIFYKTPRVIESEWAAI